MLPVFYSFFVKGYTLLETYGNDEDNLCAEASLSRFTEPTPGIKTFPKPRCASTASNKAHSLVY